MKLSDTAIPLHQTVCSSVPAMRTRRKLPIGIQTFREIRDEGHETRKSMHSVLKGADVDTVFAPELPGLDRDEIRH
ncbi:MAG: hypothetical protein Fur007_09880 [Rhodoferax sp.]